VEPLAHDSVEDARERTVESGGAREENGGGGGGQQRAGASAEGAPWMEVLSDLARWGSGCHGRTLGSGAEGAQRNARPGAMDGMCAVGEATEIGIRATAEQYTKNCGHLH
jgi:hypothetical protein